MSKPPRDLFTGTSRTYFVTANTAEGRCLLQSDSMAALFIDTLYKYRAEKKFLLHAFVVMRNHVHLLITLAEDVSLERAMQLIKGGFSYRAGEIVGRRIEIWSRGYLDHRVRFPGDLEQHRAYIHQNPVREHRVEKAEDFPFLLRTPGTSSTRSRRG